MSINELEEGQTGSIISISASPALKRRLMDMGFTKGTEIQVVNYAPMNDPIIVKLRGYNVCIRREEADGIEVGCCGKQRNCRRRRNGKRT